MLIVTYSDVCSAFELSKRVTITSKTQSYCDRIVKIRLAQAGVVCHLFGYVYMHMPDDRL